MEDFFELLSSTNDLVTIEVETSGFSMTHNFIIVSVREYLDGLELFTNNEGKIFLSRLACELLGTEEDGETISYILKSNNGVLLTITVACES